MTTALLIIDIQNDYFPGGRMELHHADAAGLQASRLLAHFRTSGQTVLHVRHIANDPAATYFLPDTLGVEIHTLVQPEKGEAVITKHTPNSFHETDLKARLDAHGIDRLVIAGMMTHMCVDSSVRAASDAGFDCVVVSDACATRDQTYAATTVGAESVQTAFLAALSGTFATVLPLNEVI